jgi:integrase
MAKRRGHNEGSIYDTPDGRHRAQVRLPNGKRPSKVFATKREAQQWIVKMLKAAQDGEVIPSDKITFGYILDRWYSDVVVPTLRPKTIASYESMIRVHIRPELGNIKLANLRPEVIQRFYVGKTKQVSRRTVQYMHAIIHRALAQAVRWNLLGQNPADAVDAPRPRRSAMQTLSPAEAARFLRSLAGDRLYAMYVLALMTGMRQGELFGLRWSDVDLDQGAIHITATLQRIKGQGVVLGEPKTERGRRQIALPAPAVKVLRTHRRRQLSERLLQGADWHDLGYVFTSTIGTPLCQSNVRKHMDKALEAADLPRVRFHDLRHTAASLLLAMGTHPRIVQELLGHEDVDLTLGTYSHTLPTMQEDAVDGLAKLLGL